VKEKWKNRGKTKQGMLRWSFTMWYAYTNTQPLTSKDGT